MAISEISRLNSTSTNISVSENVATNSSVNQNVIFNSNTNIFRESDRDTVVNNRLSNIVRGEIRPCDSVSNIGDSFESDKFSTVENSTICEIQSTVSTVTSIEKLLHDVVCNVHSMGNASCTSILKIEARNPVFEDRVMSLYVLIDTGASHSLLAKTVSRQLQLETTPGGQMNFVTVNNTSSKSYCTADISIGNVSDLSHGINIRDSDYVDINQSEEMLDTTVLNLIIVDTLPIKMIMASPRKMTRVPVSIIIGQDYCWSLIKPEPFVRLEGGLIRLATIFGPIYCGNSNKSLPMRPESLIMTSIGEMSEEDFWALEKIGIEGDMEINAESKLNNSILQEFEKTVQIFDGDIFVKFPWKENHPIIHNNFGLAKRRLLHQLKLLENQPELLAKYNSEFVGQLERGVLEIAPFHPDGKITYYIPHHGVIKPDSMTTKLRIVLDASSHHKGELSLNEILHTGPQLVPNMIGVLLRARMFKYLIISDVEKAFHQVKLQISERDATRILWLKDLNQPPTPENIIVYRYTRVPFGIKSSPYLLAISILFAMSLNETPEVVKEIEQSMYVDNLLTGASSIEEALEKQIVHKQAFRKINMNLREFMCNSSEIVNQIPLEDRMEAKEKIKLLGNQWDLINDTLAVKFKLNISGKLTKRTVLTAIAANFDPLGISIPLLIEPKYFYQTLWKSKNDYKWDTELTEDDQHAWHKIESLYGPPREIVIPRIAALALNSAQPLKLHVFSDASVKAFAAVSYVQIGQETPQILFAKNRLNPIKAKATIPKLELLAIQCAINLIHYVQKELNVVFSEINLLSDSNVALSWIKSQREIKQGIFVDNRVKFIKNAYHKFNRENKILELYHVPGEINPADFGTKGRTFEQLKDSIWFNGPKFLENQKWPKIISKFEVPEPKNEHSEHSPEIIQFSVVIEMNQTKIIDDTKFSSYTRLLRITATVILAVNLFKSKLKSKSTVNSEQIQRKITVTELQKAEIVLIRQHQAEFAQILRNDNPNTHFENNLGILCRCDRTSENLEGINKYPILIARESHFLKLIIRHFHYENGHCGVAQTVAAIQNKFRIKQLRNPVRKILSKCVVCKFINGLPYKMPPYADIPDSRLSRKIPFECTGIDFFGPIKIQGDGGAEMSVWALIFTCLVTRMIHLQPVTSLGTETFLNELRKFAARRGCPREILCDNAKTFQLAQKYTLDNSEKLDEESEIDYDCEIESDKIDLINTLANYGIRWKFTTPKAPWQGAVYERLIGTVKRTFSKLTKYRTLKFHEFETVLCEVEGFVNCRPLTYVGDEIGEKVLRPIDFVTPDLKLNLQICTDPELSRDPDYMPAAPKNRIEVESCIKRLNRLINSMWNSFKFNYIQILRNRPENKFKYRGSTVDPKIGEIVLLADTDLKRGQYRLGKLVELHKSADGKIRSASLVLGNKRIVKRTLNQLVPLEIV